MQPGVQPSTLGVKVTLILLHCHLVPHSGTHHFLCRRHSFSLAVVSLQHLLNLLIPLLVPVVGHHLVLLKLLLQLLLPVCCFLWSSEEENRPVIINTEILDVQYNMNKDSTDHQETG